MRILSFDGGGIRGLFQAAVLNAASSYNDLRDFHCQAHVLAGTSTGAIVATGLAAGRSPKYLLNLYKEVGGRVFSKKTGWLRFHPYRQAFYTTEPLQEALDRTYGTRPFHDKKSPRCLIPAVSLKSLTCEIFDSHSTDLTGNNAPTILDVVLASAAAPAFFRPHSFGLGKVYVDGGLVANNPSLVAVTQLLREGTALDTIKVLSIGTSASKTEMQNQSMRPWWLGALRSVKVCMEGSADLADQILSTALEKKYLRIDSKEGQSIALDDYANAVAFLEERAEKLVARPETQEKIKEWLAG